MFLFAALACAVQPGWSAEPAAATPERRPDAAEAVQEGNVERWLQHYQRERDWAPAREETAPAAEPAVPPDGGPAPERVEADR